jgi:hypothetical protein
MDDPLAATGKESGQRNHDGRPGLIGDHRFVSSADDAPGSPQRTLELGRGG